MAEALEHGSPSTKDPRRRRLILVVIGAFLVAAIAYGSYWVAVARLIEATDDAYVGGNMVQITPQVAGTVIGINADETQFVRVGEPLVELDRAAAHAALQKDEAELAQTVREVVNLFDHTAELEAAVKERQIDYAKTQADLTRREHLANTGAISAEETQHARDAMRAAQAALDRTHEELEGDKAFTQNTTVASHPSVERAAAQVRASYLDYQRQSIPAPVSGFVAHRAVQLGQRVSPGSALMAIVPLDEVWVDANFKERQLKSIKTGQSVRLTADANGLEYHGTVVGFAAGTGAAFAVLPAQNASGNWIKVVQRLPVRIALDSRELAAHPLQLGLSVDVKVDIGHGTRDKSAAAPRTNTVYRTAVFDSQERAADALIAEIISRNDTTPVRAAARQSSRADRGQNLQARSAH
jgi:membrane fusion protein (multidrug efflux system)